MRKVEMGDNSDLRKVGSSSGTGSDLCQHLVELRNTGMNGGSVVGKIIKKFKSSELKGLERECRDRN
jgi:hypothetical protein